LEEEDLCEFGCGGVIVRGVVGDDDVIWFE